MKTLLNRCAPGPSDRSSGGPPRLADAGRLLGAAAGGARIASNYFAQIAAGLLVADGRLTGGTYREAIRRAFDDVARRSGSRP